MSTPNLSKKDYENAPKITESYADLVKNTSSVAMESIEAIGPQMNGAIKTMKIYGNKGIWFITPTDWSGDIFFSSYTCVGGLEEFKAIYAQKEEGKKIDVNFNVKNSPKGPEAVNVSVVK